MAQHGLQRVPQVLAQVNGKVGALRRRGQHRSNLGEELSDGGSRRRRGRR